MNQHTTHQNNNNIFTNLAEHAKQIERHWTIVYQGICGASNDHPHIDIQRFDELDRKFQIALKRLHNDLESPTLILATTGTTSSGKSTIVNLLCGADLMPRMAQEMSAGVVYIHHSLDNKNHLKVHKTNGAHWECGEWHDLTDTEIRDKLTKVMDEFNKSKGINQPATPHIELTYPLACFNNPELLALSSLPKSTQFKLMDLPGLRNAQDSTNLDVIKNCSDALCLVAYNMEETDETRRLELMEQVLGQVKIMGGSPARMLFVLNRIDVFRKDRDWERYQSEHVTKTKTEISKILNKRLSEHSDVSANLTYSLLSSLPALHAWHIKVGDDRIQASKELHTTFGKLIPEEVSGDLVGNTARWSDRDFERVSDAVWKNSYGAEFFTTLDHHIQAHFPTLVIPSVVQRFDKEASHAVGEIIRACYSQLNSSKENYEQVCADLSRQNAELRQFLDQSKQILHEPFNELIEEFKKIETDLNILLHIFSEALSETKIFSGKITPEKLTPLASWRKELYDNSIGILQGVKQSLDVKTRNFSGTQADRLSKREQDHLWGACDDYILAMEKNDESRFEEQLSRFMERIYEVIYEAFNNQVRQENGRIRDTSELIMTCYLDYLRDGVNRLAPEWNLEIGHYVLANIKMPEVGFNQLENSKVIEDTEIRTWAVIGTGVAFLFAAPIAVPMLVTSIIGLFNPKEKRKLPDAESIYRNVSEQLNQQLDSLIEPFHQMIHDYINDLTQTVIKEQERVLNDFTVKLEQANQGHQNNHEKVIADWQPLYDQAQQFKDELSQLTDTRNYL